MNKVLLSMAALSTVAVAAPAASQSNWSGNSWNADAGAGIANRIAQLDARVQAGIRSGEINRTEARNLRAQLRYLTRLEGRYGANGFTREERRDLQQRLRTVHQQVRVADRGRYDRDTRYSWDDRDDDNNVYNGRGGPYERPYDTYCDNNARSGGIGGLISGILGGRDDNDCALRVGSRVPSNLYAVPSQYRYQFRDGNGVYYRSDGRNIYQIDARTRTVLRAYSMDR